MTKFLPYPLTTVLASISNASFPPSLRFDSFSAKTSRSSNLLLHSSTHPTIDYTAAEGTDTNDQYLRHYVAVYNPSTSSLQITQARKLTVRGSLRSHQKADTRDEAGPVLSGGQQGTRAALTEAFGSKKSKKAAQAIAENRMLGQGDEGATITNAMLAGVKEEDSEEDTTRPSSVHTNKPLPPANLQTQDIKNVYSLNTLVHPEPASNTLKALNIGTWLARIKVDKEIKQLRSRFVANRLGVIAKMYKATEGDDDSLIQQFQLLRYITLLLEVYQYLNKQPRRRPVPDIDAWSPNTVSSDTPSILLQPILDHLFPDHTLSDRGITLLRTTIMALTLHITPPNREIQKTTLVTDPADIQFDLAIEPAEARKLFHELGCRVKPPSDRDLMLWGFNKRSKKEKDNDGVAAAAGKPNFAVLSFPLNFPKASGGRRAAARR